MADSWFDKLVAKWLTHCEDVEISPEDIDLARSYIDGEAYDSGGWRKPPSLVALQCWYIAAEELCETEEDGDELMTSPLWRLLSLTEKAYQMGLADAAKAESPQTPPVTL